jgi:hypothetical protein
MMSIPHLLAAALRTGMQLEDQFEFSIGLDIAKYASRITTTRAIIMCPMRTDGPPDDQEEHTMTACARPALTG